MRRVLPRWWVALAALAALALAACASDQEVVTQDVVFTIPWQVPEETTYRLLSDGEVIGRGVLRMEEEDGTLRLTQEFNFPERGFQDTVVARVDRQTLKPLSVERVLSGPEGDRIWDVQYLGDTVEVLQRAGDDQRSDQISVPEHAYDSWSNLFLWRTIDFRIGYRATYNDVLTAVLEQPGRTAITLLVISKRMVQVPAGEFEAWDLQIRAGGQEGMASFSTTEPRLLLRYDDGVVVFELEGMS